MRPQRVGQHVGAVGVRPLVVLRPGLALAVGLDHEAAEVGDQGVDLVGLRPPPPGHRRIERIGGLKLAQHLRRGEVGGQIETDAVRPERVGQRRRLLQVVGAQRLRVGVDAVDDGAVEAERRVGARVVDHARVYPIGQLAPVPQRAARVAAFDAAVEVVPVIQQAAIQPRPLGDVERAIGRSGLQQPKETERAVERADLAGRRDHGRGPAGDRRGPDHEAFRPQRSEPRVPAQRANDRRPRGRADDERPRRRHRIGPSEGRAEQAALARVNSATTTRSVGESARATRVVSARSYAARSAASSTRA